MRVSVVISIMNSHEGVRRQLLYLSRLKIPDEMEFVFVDDGSDPPLTGELKNLRWIYTNDKRPWTQAIARNMGVNASNGEYVFCTDIDHIITQEFIGYLIGATCDVAYFSRRAGVLDENGVFTDSEDVLRSYGLTQKWFDRGLDLSRHMNSYLIKKSLFQALGGSDESCILVYPTKEDVPMRNKIRQLLAQGKITVEYDKATMYAFPTAGFCGDRHANPFGIFNFLYKRK